MSINTRRCLSYPPRAVQWLLTFALLLAASKASAKQLEFDVFLEDRPIGSHEFTLQEIDDITEVSINANFKVKVLFVTAFNYRHQNTETWQNNCLRKIEATTVVNGKTFEVSGNQATNQFEVELPGTANPNIDCARSFAYWDRSLLPATRVPENSSPLLNAQTGEFVAATLTDLGKGEMTIGDTPVEVNRYRLKGKDVQVTLAYAQTPTGQEEWVGLSSEVAGGRTLKYVRTEESLTQPSASR